MAVREQTYRVLDTETVSETHTHQVTERRPVETPMIDALGSIVAFNLSLLLLIVLIAGQLTGRFHLTEDERELLELRRNRDEFDDWISRGTFPADRGFEATVLVEELVDLVDVAIDTNNRVIEDEQLGVSAVLDDDYVYLYIHPDSPAREWLVNYADTTLDAFGGPGG